MTPAFKPELGHMLMTGNPWLTGHSCISGLKVGVRVCADDIVCTASEDSPIAPPFKAESEHVPMIWRKGPVKTVL